MRLIRDDNDIITIRKAFVGIHNLIELLNQREDVRLLLGQEPVQVISASSSARVTP